MSGIDVPSHLRRLALLSEGRLALLYTIGVLPATFLGELASVQPELVWLTVVAAAVGLCSVSVLITVVTFYQDHDAFFAGVILGLITVLGTALAWALSSAVILQSIGVLIAFAPVGIFSQLVRVLFVAPAFVGLVWILRRFRRWLAPDTLADAG